VLSGAKRFSDYRELLAYDEVDAVEICTPHTLHVSQILDAIDSNKHILCEKPLVTSVEDARIVLERHHGSPLVGLIGYQRHQIAEYQYIRDQIARETFGKVTYVSAMQSQEWKQLTAGTWRQDPKLSGGGQLNDSGSHFVDIILWTTWLHPESVSAYVDFDGTQVDINSNLAIRFSEGALGTISIVGNAPNWHEELTIWCENGAFYVREGQLTVVHADGSKVQISDLPQGSRNPDEHFVACILGKEEPLAPFAGALRVIELTEAAWKSAASGGDSVRI